MPHCRLHIHKSLLQIAHADTAHAMVLMVVFGSPQVVMVLRVSYIAVYDGVQTDGNQ